MAAIGSRSIGRREGQFVWWSSGGEQHVIPMDALPLPRPLLSDADQRELMRALAAAWALGVVPDEDKFQGRRGPSRAHGLLLLAFLLPLLIVFRFTQDIDLPAGKFCCKPYVLPFFPDGE